jgi:hypothetical protein
VLLHPSPLLGHRQFLCRHIVEQVPDATEQVLCALFDPVGDHLDDPATENRKCIEEDDQSENGVEHSAVGHSVHPLVAAHPIAAPHDAATPGFGSRY